MHYINIFYLQIDINNLLHKEFIKLEASYREGENFGMYLPNFTEEKLVPTHTRNKNAFIWSEVTKPKIQDEITIYKSTISNLSFTSQLKTLKELREEAEKPISSLVGSEYLKSEVKLIIFISSNITFDKNFLYQIYLPKNMFNKEDFREVLLRNTYSLHLLSYWDIVESNRIKILQNSFSTFLDKTTNFIYFTKGISKQRISLCTFYLLYICGIIICNNPGKLTKNLKKSEIINIFPFLKMKNGRKAPMEVNQGKYEAFCETLKKLKN